MRNVYSDGKEHTVKDNLKVLSQKFSSWALGIFPATQHIELPAQEYVSCHRHRRTATVGGF